MQYYNDSSILFVNGNYVRSAEAVTGLYGQSLHYGYGVFEGIRAYNTHNGTRVFKAEEHFARLQRSCELVNIPYKWNNDHLIKETYRLLEINRLKNAYIRPLVYCGPNMSLTRPVDVSIMICAWEWGACLGNKLLRVCISGFQRPNPKSTKIEAKVTGNYVNSILATTEARDRGYDEALLLDMHEKVAQAPGANFFMEKYGRLYTPPKGNILPGITRDTVIDICKNHDIEVLERRLTVDDIKSADSAFLCGTSTEIVGIGSIDGTEFKTDWQETIGSTIQRTYKNLVLEKENYEVII